jgi:putative ABC transport system substrate-binding protein
VSTLGPELSGKRLDLLKAAIPTISRVGMFYDPDEQGMDLSWQQTEAAARALGVQLQSLAVRSAEQFNRVAERVGREPPDALIINGGTLLNAVVDARIGEFAQRHGLPTMWAVVEEVRDWEGLMGYSPNNAALHRRGAYYVDRILKGAKPADLPVEQPMRFDFVINLRTAQSLELTIPHHVLLQATEIIQ